MTKTSYFSLMASPEYEKTRFIQSTYPPFNEEYFEWIDLLESVIDAKFRFTMIELGAGWGRWLCQAGKALGQVNPQIPYHLIGVEAEPTHFAWMKEHFKENGIDLTKCNLIQAAVSKKDGICRFFVGDAYSSYGQRIASNIEEDKKIQEVEAISLKTLLNGLDLVDLIDLDVQGAEYDILAAVPQKLWGKIKRIHIGTHSTKVEMNLKKLFKKLGWENKYDFPMSKKIETEYGEISFQDGVQSWVNPHYSFSGKSTKTQANKSWLAHLFKR
jgi:FkbM family methyltransferase